MEQNSFPITLRCKAKLLRSMTPLICRLLFTSGRNKFIVLSFAYWLFFIISLLTYPKKPFRKKIGYVSPEPVRCACHLCTCRLQPRDEFKKYNLFHIHNQSSKLNASDYVEEEGENDVNDVMMR